MELNFGGTKLSGYQIKINCGNKFSRFRQQQQEQSNNSRSYKK